MALKILNLPYPNRAGLSVISQAFLALSFSIIEMGGGGRREREILYVFLVPTHGSNTLEGKSVNTKTNQ